MTKLVYGPGSGGTSHPSRLLLVVVLIALVAGACGSTTPTPRRTATAQGSSAPSGAPSQAPGGSNPTPTPVPPPSGDWAAVDLPPLEPIASLTPTRKGLAGAAVDTAFQLASLDGTPTAKLAAALEVTPRITFTRAAVGATSATLTPTRPLTPGTTYRFSIHRPDGTIAGAWAITAAKTLQVVGTLPENESSEVPRNTGIEFSFDQPGVTAAAVNHAFSISPDVHGRFEAHGKVVAFVPSSRLKAFTLYTVTLRKGIPLPGTGQRLEHDVVVRFETKGGNADQALIIPDPMVDSAVALKPTISVYFRNDEGTPTSTPTSLPLTIHRLAGLKAATAAYRRIDEQPEWARSAGAPIATGGLTLILTGTAPVHRYQGDDGGETRTWVDIPQTLPAGWYVATLTYAGRREQVILQITDLALYAMVTETRSAVWVNALDTGRPVAGAAVTVAGTSVGRTDSKGLRIAATPSILKVASTDPRHQFVSVRDHAGRAVFVPVDGQSICEKCYGFDTSGVDPSDHWWHVLATDRDFLRTTDQVNAWGVIRARADGALPKRLEVRLQAYDDWTATSIPIVTARPTPSASGVFTATLAFKDLPVGYYAVEMRADGEAVGSSSVQIGPISKPAWRLDITTGRRWVMSGDSVDVHAAAAFFEGTPVAGVALEVRTSGEDDEAGPAVTMSTGPDGTAEHRATVALSTTEDDVPSQWAWRSLAVAATLPEEADIWSETWVAAFRSNALLGVDATLDGTTLTITGNVHDVDFAKVEATDAGDWGLDPAGAPRANARVTLDITEQVTTRTQVGTAYDFVTKTTSPVYRYSQRNTSLGSRTATTGADGTFRVPMTVNGGDRTYEVTASYTDPAGRTIAARGYGSTVPLASTGDGQLIPIGRVASDEQLYRIGDRIKLEARGGRAAPARDRYLFTVAHLGLRSATVQAGPAFAATFRGSWVPNVAIDGVRFNGTTYESMGRYDASFDRADRSLQVRMTADASRYEPGGHARVAIRTLRADGRPVSASVVVRVVDEKLFAIGAANDVDVLGELYTPVSLGIIGVAWSHGVPKPQFEGGDTTGGGGDERDDFRDWLLFKQVTTDADGRASVTVDLSDDLTSWRVVGAAVDGSYRAGSGRLDLAVGKPFFVEAALAPTYLAGDRPVLRLRGYGSALRDGAKVSFAVTSDTLGVKGATASAPAFTAASLDLPALTAGDHRIRIVATTGTGAARHEDVLIRTIRVVDSRSVQGRTASGPLVPGFRLQGGTTGATSIALSDGGRGRALPVLLGLLDPATGRADQALAASLARRTLLDAFDLPRDDVPADTIDLRPFASGGEGVALLPYASPDLELTALAALANDPGLDAGELRGLFTQVLSIKTSSRERRIVALTGLAALGDPVLVDIRSAARATDLSIVERSWLAVAALAGGDETLARSLERDVLNDHGQRLGPWVRVKNGDAEQTVTTTALLAMAAAGLGDPVAAGSRRVRRGEPTKGHGPGPAASDRGERLGATHPRPGRQGLAPGRRDDPPGRHPGHGARLDQPDAGPARVSRPDAGQRHRPRHVALGGRARCGLAPTRRHHDVHPHRFPVGQRSRSMASSPSTSPCASGATPTTAAGRSPISSRPVSRP